MGRLVLRRNPYQGVQIGKDVRVFFVEYDYKHGQAVLSFEAPSEVRIMRLELLDRAVVQCQNAASETMDGNGRGDGG